MSQAERQAVETRIARDGSGGVRIDAAKYEAVRRAILRAVPRDDEGIEFRALPGAVRALLPGGGVPGGGSISRYVTTVKQDLEARGLIERVAGSRPQRLRRLGGGPELARTGSTDPRAEAYFRQLRPPVREAAAALRAVVRQAAPNLVESFKWKMPVYVGHGNVMYIAARAEHVTLGFYRGAELDDERSLLDGTGKGLRSMRASSTGDIPRRALAQLVKQAVEIDAT